MENRGKVELLMVKEAMLVLEAMASTDGSMRKTAVEYGSFVQRILVTVSARVYIAGRSLTAAIEKHKTYSSWLQMAEVAVKHG